MRSCEGQVGLAMDDTRLDAGKEYGR